MLPLWNLEKTTLLQNFRNVYIYIFFESSIFKFSIINISTRNIYNEGSAVYSSARVVQLGAVPDIRPETRLADYWATRRRRWGVNYSLPFPAFLQCLPRKLPVCANFTRIFTVFRNPLLLIPPRGIILIGGRSIAFTPLRFDCWT